MTQTNSTISETMSQLQKLLSSYHIYYQNLRGYHWNIKGKQFFELHLKFEAYYNDAAIKIDEVAERILTLGGKPLHSYSQYLKHSYIKEHVDISDGDIAVEQIKAQLKALIDIQRQLLEISEKTKDAGTADLATRFISEQEKTMWMLEAYLS